MSITIYTDGASRGNPGPGGYGAVILIASGEDGKVIEIGGHEDNTTNNRMELRAALESLRYVEERKLSGSIEIYTDSVYTLNGITGWVFGWQKNGWKTSNGDQVLNQDIWEPLAAISFRLKQKQGITWIKVKGHSGVFLNERADSVATTYADHTPYALFTGALSLYKKLYSFNQENTEPVITETKKTISKNKKPYAYVSYVGGSFFVDQTWDVCEKRVRGVGGARFKKVFSEEELETIQKEWTQ